MYDFFVGVPNRLELFGTVHLILMGVFAALCVLLVVFRKKLRSFGHFGAVQKIMAAVLLLNMLVHYSTRIIYGIWEFGVDLPLHICFVTNFFMMYILFTGNKHNLFSVVYFFTLIGPLPAIIFPDSDYSGESFIFWQYIISHHIMLLSSLYCIVVSEYKTTLKSAGLAFLIGNGYVGLMAVFNGIFGTNYVMIGELPDVLYRTFPFLNALPAVVWLEMVGIVALALGYLFYLALRRIDTKKIRKTY